MLTGTSLASCYVGLANMTSSFRTQLHVFSLDFSPGLPQGKSTVIYQATLPYLGFSLHHSGWEDLGSICSASSGQDEFTTENRKFPSIEQP